MSLIGRYGNTSRAPFLEGRLLFPRLGLVTNISFLVDTGADFPVLMPDDGARSNLDYSKLTGTEDVGGAGGQTKMFPEQGFVVFAEPGVGIHLYNVKILIAPPAPDLQGVPSLLGRSVLNRWHMTYHPPKLLSFEVVSAD